MTEADEGVSRPDPRHGPRIALVTGATGEDGSYRPADPKDLVGDASRLRSLGWEPGVGFAQLVCVMIRADLREVDGQWPEAGIDGRLRDARGAVVSDSTGDLIEVG